MFPALAFLALLIEVSVGYPDRLFHAMGHPVTWIARLIAMLDRRFNRTSMRDELRRAAGVACVFLLVGLVSGLALALERCLFLFPFGLLAAAIAGSTFIAQRSLYQHVLRVACALDQRGVEGGREAVSHIVGRDTATLDQAGIARAAIESLAENFSDGIVAPTFWMVIGGLTGGAVYKAINTADSMIGHRTPRHAQFGWAAARLDDLVNLPASRLSALLITTAAATIPGASAANAWRAVLRDAARHRSPNAGYPEAAMAGALGLALGGPRTYAGVQVEDERMGHGRRDATVAEIHAALALYRRADALLIVLVGGIAAAVIATS